MHIRSLGYRLQVLKIGIQRENVFLSNGLAELYIGKIELITEIRQNFQTLLGITQQFHVFFNFKKEIKL